MANYGAFLLIVSLLVAVAAFSSADARPTVRPDKMAAALPDADDVHGRGLVAADASPVVANPECNGDDDEETKKKKKKKKKKEKKPHHKDETSSHAPPPDYAADSPHPATMADSPHPATTADSPRPATTAGSLEQELLADSPHPATTADSPRPATTADAPPPATTSDSLEQELCTTCEVPPPPEPACNPCEEPKEPQLVCKKVHAVRDGETCYSMGQCAGLGQDDFLKFNPNICCDHLFVGQWVCLEAECSEESE